MLLTAEEVAQWVRHAVQLPQDVADAFLRNAVTGYDFHELTQNQVRFFLPAFFWWLMFFAFRQRLKRTERGGMEDKMARFVLGNIISLDEKIIRLYIYIHHARISFGIIAQY